MRQSIPIELLERCTPDDQEHLLDFQEFLQAVGPMTAPDYRQRLKTLVEGDPDRWLPYVGFSRAEAQAAGYAV